MYVYVCVCLCAHEREGEREGGGEGGGVGGCYVFAKLDSVCTFPSVSAFTKLYCLCFSLLLKKICTRECVFITPRSVLSMCSFTAM